MEDNRQELNNTLPIYSKLTSMEIYCGALAALCMPLYFLNKRVPLKKKLG